MNMSKQLLHVNVVLVIILLFLGSSVTSAQANNVWIGTPTPTFMPNLTIPSIGKTPSAEEQNQLKAIVRSFIEIRYKALSASSVDDYKQSGFGNMPNFNKTLA